MPTRAKESPKELAIAANGKVRREPFTTQSGYEVRPLTGKDLRRLKKLIGDNIDAVQAKLSDLEDKQLQKAKDAGPDVQIPLDAGAGMAVVEVLLEDAFDDAWEFLASMIGMTADRFDEEPLDAHLEIIETLVQQDNLPAFLERYMALRTTFSAVLPTSASSDTEAPNGN